MLLRPTGRPARRVSPTTKKSSPACEYACPAGSAGDEASQDTVTSQRNTPVPPLG